MLNCIIVGGGAVGLMTARELAQAGCQVRLLDRGDIGRESSWAGGGILSPLQPWRVPESLIALAKASEVQYPALAEALRDHTGIDPEWTQSGLLWLDLADEAAAVAWAHRYQARFEVLEAQDAIAAIEPGCRAAKRALWFPGVAQIRNPRLVTALARDLERRGVEIMPHRPVEALMLGGDRVKGVRLADGVLEADAVIVAAGAWSARLLDPLGVSLGIEPVKGQMLLYRATPGLLRRIVSDGERYVIPRRDGHVLVGSTLEHIQFDKSVTPLARADLRRAAENIVPALARCDIVDQWAGLRPGSPDGVPHIGAAPGVPGLYVNAGHYRNGLLLAPASAQLLADLLLGRAPALDASAFAPGR